MSNDNTPEFNASFVRDVLLNNPLNTELKLYVDHIMKRILETASNTNRTWLQQGMDEFLLDRRNKIFIHAYFTDKGFKVTPFEKQLNDDEFKFEPLTFSWL